MKTSAQDFQTRSPESAPRGANSCSGPSNILLVHGAWHGPWCWEKLVPELDRARWNVATVELPSASADPGNRSGMYDDARAIQERLGRIDGPTVVLAHSYGGFPATEAAAAAGNVAQLIYLCAFQLDEGASLAGTIGDGLPRGNSGTMAPPEDPVETFYGGVAQDDVDRALARLVPQTIKSFNEQLTRASWKAIPSTYLVCQQDKAIPTALQESMAARATTIHRLPSGHSPFLSMPGELARLITAVAATTPERV